MMMLTKQELSAMTNEELVEIYQNRDDRYSPRESKEAVNVLIINNQKLVHAALKRITCNYRVDFDEAYMYGLEVLYMIASTFDPERHLKFSTYAVSQLFYKLTDLMNTRTYGDVSTHYASHHKPIRQAIQAIKEERGNDIEPTAREICDWLKTFRRMTVRQSTVQNCLAQMRFSNPISIDDDNNHHAVISTTDPENTEVSMYQAELQRDMMSALNNLPLEERFCFEQYNGYPTGKRHNAEQIAAMMNKDPRFIARKKDPTKQISAFYVHKYLKNAALLLRKNTLLRRYQNESSSGSDMNNAILDNFTLTGQVDESAMMFMEEVANARFQHVAKSKRHKNDDENK